MHNKTSNQENLNFLEREKENGNSMLEHGRQSLAQWSTEELCFPIDLGETEDANKPNLFFK